MLYEEADLYAAAFRWPVQEEVDWLLEETGGASPRGTRRSVFEPFCGNARYAEAFVRRGLEYWGLDLSEAMLARAPRGKAIHLRRGDVRRFDLPARFDLAWCPVNSIRHLHDEESVLAHLSCVRRHLAEGGAYVVELELVNHDGPWTEPDPASGVWSEAQPDGSVVRASWRRRTCARAERTCVERATFAREQEGRVVQSVVHDFTMRMWTHDDLLGFVARSGLAIDRVHRHESESSRPRVALSAALENSGESSYYFLRPAPG